MSTVYDEALLDARKIRDAAEQAAQARVMETITPQIREMINNRILFEQDETDDDDSDEDDDGAMGGMEDDYDLESMLNGMPDVGVDFEDAASQEAVGHAGSVSVHASGDVNINVSESHDEMMLGEAGANVLASLINKDFVAPRRLEEKIDNLSKRVKKLGDVVSVLRESKLSTVKRKRLELGFMSCVKDAVSLQNEVKSSGTGHRRLHAKLNSTIKEMREMSSKYKKNIFDFLFEGDDAESKKKNADDVVNEQEEGGEDVEVLDGGLEDSGDELDLDVEEEGVPTGDVDVDAATSALQSLGSALGLELEIVGEEGGEEGFDDEMDYEEGGEEGFDDVEELDVDLEESAWSGLKESDDLDEVYEIDESVLRKELSRMRNGNGRKGRTVRESRGRSKLRRMVREAAEDEADQFGDGKILGDVIEIDEDTLINVLADELGSVAESRRRRPAPRGRRSVGPSRGHTRAMKEAKTYKTAATKLKKQLVEMNMFNAKLLFANKLLQNKGLTVKQQRAIVEAIDNAKTLREAKLLYKSLSESLTRRGQGGEMLSEGKRTLGSSSRSTRSAQPAKSGVDAGRWAVLAGLPGK